MLAVGLTNDGPRETGYAPVEKRDPGILMWVLIHKNWYRAVH